MLLVEIARGLRVGLKHAWRDGTHAVVLDPLDLIARLVGLIPPPRFHLLRYRQRKQPTTALARPRVQLMIMGN
ncbi:MAG: transposase [Enhygromyxa sp.]